MFTNPESDFHKLWNSANDNAGDAPRADGSVEVNGVVLPLVVANELRRLGVPLEFYSAGQLQSAVQACAVDETLIDDPDGDNFLDELNLSDSEAQTEGESIYSAFRLPAKDWHSHDFQHGLGKENDWSSYVRERDEDKSLCA